MLEANCHKAEKNETEFEREIRCCDTKEIAAAVWKGEVINNVDVKRNQNSRTKKNKINKNVSQ